MVSDFDTEQGSIRYVQGENNKGCGNIFTENGVSLSSENYEFQYHYKNNTNSPRQNPYNISGNIKTVTKNEQVCDQIGRENPMIAPPETPVDWQNTLLNDYNSVSTALATTKSTYSLHGYENIPNDWNTYFD